MDINSPKHERIEKSQFNCFPIFHESPSGLDIELIKNSTDTWSGDYLTCETDNQRAVLISVFRFFLQILYLEYRGLFQINRADLKQYSEIEVHITH